MSVPSANLSYQFTTLSSVRFKNLSDDGGKPITGAAWDFGDSGTSTELEIADHTYSTSGIYLISLTVTNEDGESTKSFYLTVNVDAPTLAQSILDMAKPKIPSSLFDPITLSGYIQKWQLYLQPQINPEAIADQDVFNEEKWPSLANVLISELLIWEIIMQEAQKFSASGSIPIGPDPTDSESAGIKEIETGPSKTSWYDVNDSRNEFFRAMFSNQSQMIPAYQAEMCMWARRIRVTLPFCSQVLQNHLFKKVGRRIYKPGSTVPPGFTNKIAR